MTQVISDTFVDLSEGLSEFGMVVVFNGIVSSKCW